MRVAILRNIITDPDVCNCRKRLGTMVFSSSVCMIVLWQAAQSPAPVRPDWVYPTGPIPWIIGVVSIAATCIVAAVGWIIQMLNTRITDMVNASNARLTDAINSSATRTTEAISACNARMTELRKDLMDDSSRVRTEVLSSNAQHEAHVDTMFHDQFHHEFDPLKDHIDNMPKQMAELIAAHKLSCTGKNGPGSGKVMNAGSGNS